MQLSLINKRRTHFCILLCIRIVLMLNFFFDLLFVCSELADGVVDKPVGGDVANNTAAGAPNAGNGDIAGNPANGNNIEPPTNGSSVVVVAGGIGGGGGGMYVNPATRRYNSGAPGAGNPMYNNNNTNTNTNNRMNNNNNSYNRNGYGGGSGGGGYFQDWNRPLAADDALEKYCILEQQQKNSFDRHLFTFHSTYLHGDADDAINPLPFRANCHVLSRFCFCAFVC